MKDPDFIAAKKYVIDRFIHEASSKLYYHGLHHTLDVYNSVRQLAVMEGMNTEELLLLETAALYHDIGFLEQYGNNEVIAAKIARKVLPEFGFDTNQIERIANMILATDITKSPQTLSEKILCDADLDYLGREDFSTFAGQLKKELNVMGSLVSEKQWDEIQVGFLEKHTYYTSSAIELRERTKQKHLDEIKERLRSAKYP